MLTISLRSDRMVIVEDLITANDHFELRVPEILYVRKIEFEKFSNTALVYLINPQSAKYKISISDIRCIFEI
jgi:hypothetical protein